MVICIIAGGSGTRLWPLSTPEYPKHLLKLNGDDKSLLQNTYDRAKAISDNIYIVTEEGHAHHIKDQLPDLSDDNFVIEPARRGTASCIIAALDRVSKIHGPDEVVAMIHSDHFIRDVQGFSHSFKVASEISEAEKRIVLIGVEPTYPAIIFGYIQKGEILDGDNLVYDVHSFKEKPDFNTASDYLNSGNYLWNCGYFVASVATFKEKMQKFSPQLYENFNRLEAAAPQEYADVYLQFENDAIDYALVEKVEDLLVVPASFDWMDVGSYQDLHAATTTDERGNYIGEGYIEIDDVDNSYLENQEDKPVAVIGLDNVVVINTKDGVLVTRKDLGPKVGDVAKRIAAKKTPGA